LAGPQNELLQIVGIGTANFGGFGGFFEALARDLLWRRGMAAIIGGALIGIVLGRAYLRLIGSRRSDSQPISAR